MTFFFFLNKWLIWVNGGLTLMFQGEDPEQGVHEEVHSLCQKCDPRADDGGSQSHRRGILQAAEPRPDGHRYRQGERKSSWVQDVSMIYITDPFI